MNLRRSSAKGFTLAEVLVTCALCTIVAGGVYAIVQTATNVSARALAGSASATANRLAMDRMGQMLQLSFNAPTLINHNGVDVSGTSTAQGIRFQRYMGGPYVVTIPSGGLQSSVVTMTVTAANNANIPPPAPEPNDILIINTTAMASGSDTQVMAYITSPVSKSTVGNKTTYSLRLAQQLGTTVTADTGATVTAILVRPTAFVLKPTAAGRELRLIELYPKATSINVNNNYTVLTPQVALPQDSTTSSANDPMTDAAAKPFSLIINNTHTFAKIAFGVRSSNYDGFLNKKKTNSVDTYVKTETVIALKCNQNQ